MSDNSKIEWTDVESRVRLVEVERRLSGVVELESANLQRRHVCGNQSCKKAFTGELV
ncbi:MAG TPA: hypothetical protein PKE47_00650 [Verrucomicrobiota bacterium]|nr:hypothetical protein [Verrucomicrobiota bacterium]